MAGSYGLLLETYETELLKITSIWEAFPESSLDFKPHPKSRSVMERVQFRAPRATAGVNWVIGSRFSVGDFTTVDCLTLQSIGQPTTSQAIQQHQARCRP